MTYKYRGKDIRVQKILELIKEETPIDTVMDVFCSSEFVEVVGRAGGDVLTYRFYNNGTVTER